MSSKDRIMRGGAALLLLATATASAGALDGTARPAEAVRCEIGLSRTAGGVTLTALARAEERVAGHYSLRVSGSGTDIRQGGSFEAAPGRPATLGTVSLGTVGGGYRADLDLDVGGRVLSCSKRVGGGI